MIRGMAIRPRRQDPGRWLRPPKASLRPPRRPADAGGVEPARLRPRSGPGRRTIPAPPGPGQPPVRPRLQARIGPRSGPGPGTRTLPAPAPAPVRHRSGSSAGQPRPGPSTSGRPAQEQPAGQAVRRGQGLEPGGRPRAGKDRRQGDVPGKEPARPGLALAYSPDARRWPPERAARPPVGRPPRSPPSELASGGGVDLVLFARRQDAGRGHASARSRWTSRRARSGELQPSRRMNMMVLPTARPWPPRRQAKTAADDSASASTERRRHPALDVATGRRTAVLPMPAGRVIRLTYSPDAGPGRIDPGADRDLWTWPRPPPSSR